MTESKIIIPEELGEFNDYTRFRHYDFEKDYGKTNAQNAGFGNNLSAWIRHSAYFNPETGTSFDQPRMFRILPDDAKLLAKTNFQLVKIGTNFNQAMPRIHELIVHDNNLLYSRMEEAAHDVKTCCAQIMRVVGNT